jgi:hypothetical protein
MKYLKLFILFLFMGSSASAQLGGYAGAFTRMGFGARGISMGNAMTSVTSGDVIGYYNPALSSFQNEHLIGLSYSFLSLDRSLNFVSYTKNFKLPKQEQGGAGVTFSWINAGVSDIDGRDNDGFHTAYLSTFENQFLFAPSIRVSEKVAIGFGFKFYFSKLYEGVKSTSFGFDLGALYRVTDRINAAFSVKDINSKNEWNTNELYEQFGNVTRDKFPKLYTLGVSYLLPNNFGIVSADYEVSTKRSQILRLGIEVSPVKDINFRGGFDRFDFISKDKFGNSALAFGVGYQKAFSNYIVGLDYSFVMEPYSNKPFQTITAIFKIK